MGGPGRHRVCRSCFGPNNVRRLSSVALGGISWNTPPRHRNRLCLHRGPNKVLRMQAQRNPWKAVGLSHRVVTALLTCNTRPPRRSRQGGKPQQRWTGDQTEAPHQSRKGPLLSKKAGKEGTKETQTAGGEFLAPVAQRAWPGFSLRQWDASRQGGVPDRSHGKQRRSADTGTQRSWHAQRAASCWKEQPLLSRPRPGWNPSRGLRKRELADCHNRSAQVRSGRRRWIAPT